MPSLRYLRPRKISPWMKDVSLALNFSFREIMRNFNRVLFAALCFFICLQVKLLANIIEIANLNDVGKEFLQLDDNSLVLFDVDYTLLIPNDAILRPCGQLLVNKFIKEILENPFVVPPEKYTQGYFLSQILTQAKSSLVDEKSLPLIKCLQDKKIRTIALTASPAGKLGIIDNMADWRIDELKKFGFDFTSAFPGVQFLEFPKREDKEFHPIFKSGILFSSKHSKGDILKQFLKSIHWMPSKVIFIDDRLEYLQSVANVLKEMGINFTGFHYIAAEKFRCELDEGLAEYQFKYLTDHSKWLSDEEAKNMIKNNTCASLNVGFFQLISKNFSKWVGTIQECRD